MMTEPYFYSWLLIIPKFQRMYCFAQHALRRIYPVSTAKKGLGERKGSECTPRGWHQIHARIGLECPRNSVFIARQWTGEIYSDQLAQQFPERDWILTRILWLEGLEEGKNRAGEVDTLSRYIYIHGTPEPMPFNQPSSHGCIRMRHDDLINLCQHVNLYTKVYIAS